MGAWSAEPFGNDTAADWSWELDDSTDWEVVRAALNEAIDADDVIDADVATCAIAAAAVVGRALGRPLAIAHDGDVVDDDAQDDETEDEVDSESDGYGDDEDDSVKAFLARISEPSAEIVQLAIDALAAASGPTSELTELWIESDETEWQAANARVRAALGG